MDFKKFKHEVKSENLNIPDLNEKVKNYSLHKDYNIKKRERKSFNILPLFKYVAVAMPIIIMLLCVCLTSIKANDSVTELNSIKNATELKKVLAYSNRYNIGDWFDIVENIGGGVNWDESIKDSPTADINGPGSLKPENSTNDDYYDTNVQEEGVDESDYIKTDGTRIYYYENGVIKVYNVETEELSYIYVTDTTSTNGYPLYVTDEYLIFVGYSYQENGMNVIMKLYDKETLELKKSYNSQGRLADSRLINNQLYIVFTQQNVSDLPVDYIDGVMHTYDYNDIKYSKSVINQGYTFLFKLNLNDLKIDIKIQLGANYWTAVYATEKSIYLTISKSCSYFSLYTIDGSRFSTNSYQTNIFRYNITEEGIEYAGLIITSGLIKNQFYLDEHNGYLRVMLQQQNNKVTGNNKLEIYNINEFDKEGYIKLETVLDKGIGKEGEQIKSVRFTDNSCLVVTYLIIDPLYYIDLTDPIKPVILGQYEEPGYNTYMHYINDELAIGFGISDGYKMGLYELVDGKPNKLEERTNYAKLPVADNHKELYIEGDIFAFASTTYDYVTDDDINNYISKLNMFQIFTINYDGEKPSLQLIKEEKSFNCTYKKMIRIKDNYYLITDSNMIIYDQSFNQTNNIEFLK